MKIILTEKEKKMFKEGYMDLINAIPENMQKDLKLDIKEIKEQFDSDEKFLNCKAAKLSGNEIEVKEEYMLDVFNLIFKAYYKPIIKNYTIIKSAIKFISSWFINIKVKQESLFNKWK